MKRSILIEGTDKELELGKVVSITSEKQFIYLEEMPNGKWRLTYSASTISDIQKIEGFKILRED